MKLVDILRAKKVLAGKINKTPLILAKNIGRETGVNLYFKPENFQKTGSFKIRGILNKLHSLTDKQKKKGIVGMSVGNHAISLAYVASLHRIPCVVVMFKTVPKSKIQLIKKMGAKVILKNRNLWAECLKLEDNYGFTPFHPFDDPLIIAGQGTIGLEILEDLPTVNYIFVPIGGGGLISGIALAVKHKNPKVKIIGVEPVGAPTMLLSLLENRIVHLDKRNTIADSLTAPSVGKLTLALTKKYIDELVLVSDCEIADSLRYLWRENKIKVEPSGVIALAAVIFKKIKMPANSKIVCVLSGGNIDNGHFQKFLKE